MFKYTGKTVQLNYDGGYSYVVEYLSDNKLRWTSLKDKVDGIPSTGEETFFINQQNDEIYTLGWVETYGFSAVLNLDFNKMEVCAFMSWNDKSARGGRAFQMLKGTIILSG